MSSPVDMQKITTLAATKKKVDEQLNESINKYKAYIANTNEKLGAHQPMLGDMAADMVQKRMRLRMQEEAIAQKRELMRTRQRMLQLSIDRNVYKRKVIYTILALILAVIVLMIAGYVTFNRSG